jgi:uncharacterized membrane protein (DUF2068 family)
LTTRTPIAPTLYVIVVLKLARAVVYLLLALQIFALAGQDLRPHFDDAVKRMRLDPEARFIKKLGDRVDAITPMNARWAATGTVLYALLQIGEGVGLALRARWAAFLAIAQSAILVLVETFALIKHPSVTITVILVLNLWIVAYLYRNRARLFPTG